MSRRPRGRFVFTPDRQALASSSDALDAFAAGEPFLVDLGSVTVAIRAFPSCQALHEAVRLDENAARVLFSAEEPRAEDKLTPHFCVVDSGGAWTLVLKGSGSELANSRNYQALALTPNPDLDLAFGVFAGWWSIVPKEVRVAFGSAGDDAAVRLAAGLTLPTPAPATASMAELVTGAQQVTLNGGAVPALGPIVGGGDFGKERR